MSWFRKSLGILAVGLTAGLATTGCEENESVLFIVGVLSVDSTDCVARPEADAIVRSGGTLDLLLSPTYRAALLVGSHLTQRGSRDQLRTETARLVLQGAEVTLTDFRGEPLQIAVNPFTAIGRGLVHPSGGEEAGYGAMFVDLIPPDLNIQDQTVIARVRAFGTTLGGAELESNEFIFPISICRGCLIDYPASAANPDALEYECSTQSQNNQQQEPLQACFIGQDSIVPCTFCSSSNAACLDPCSNCAVRRSATANCTSPEPPYCQ